MKAAPAITKTNPGQTGYKSHAIQRGETFSVSHAVLRPKPGYNERVIFHGIPELAASIESNGFSKLTPLIVEWSPSDGVFYILHGERRYRAIMHLVGKGVDPGPIWCMSEARNKDPLQQLFDQVLTNTGEQFTPLEKGRLYLRIQSDFPGTTGTEIARRVGETKQAVSNALRLAKLSSDKIQQAIISGKLSCTTALQLIDSAGDDHQAQDQLLAETLGSAQSNGKSHATPKHLPTPPAAPPASESSIPGTTTFIADPDDNSDSSDQSHSTDLPASNDPPANPNAPADPGAIERLKNAPSTNRDGSSGPGSGKYEAPDKRLKSVEKLLDDLDKKGTGLEQRVTTTEFVLRYLNNESDLSALRNHLLGK